MSLARKYATLSSVGGELTMVEVQCPSCNTRYRIDERILPKEKPTFKCSRCGHVFSSALEPSAGGAKLSGAKAPRNVSPPQGEPEAKTEASPLQSAVGPVSSTPPPQAAGGAVSSAPPESQKPAEATSQRQAAQVPPAAKDEDATAPGASGLARDPDEGERWVVEEPTSHLGATRQPSGDARAARVSAPNATPMGRRPPRSEWTIGSALDALQEQGRAARTPAGRATPAGVETPETSPHGLDPGRTTAPGEQGAAGAGIGDRARQRAVSVPPLGADEGRSISPLQEGDEAEASGSDHEGVPILAADVGSLASRDFGDEFSALGPAPGEFGARGASGAAARNSQFASEIREFTARRRSERPSERRAHSSAFFLMLLAGFVVAFAGLSVLISSQPAASREVLAWMPFVGGDFTRSSSLGQVRFESVRADFQPLKDSRNALVISGSVLNLTQRPLRTVQIRGALLDDAHREVSARAVFCGNTVQPGMVSQMTSREVAFFQGLKAPLNFELAPGQSTPFVIAFVDPPGGVARSYRVAVGRVEAAGDNDSSASVEGR